MFRKLFEKLTGLDEIKKDAEEALLRLKEIEEQKLIALSEAKIAIEEANKAEEAEHLAKLTPKERATKAKEPWVAVLDTKVNPENPRNGFFELDWNEYFILQLRQAGYGTDGDPDEEIVDRWFRDLAYNLLQEAGQDPYRGAGAGFINVVPISRGRLEVS